VSINKFPLHILSQGKKKRFIDKKNAVSFRLVHRSQRDPLQADEESSKHVLLPVGDNEALGGQTDQVGELFPGNSSGIS
jgi:hypothetical protein